MATTVDTVSQGAGGGVAVDKGAEYFGYILAYLLPGLVGLWAATYPSSKVRGWMSDAATQDASLGGFLFLMVAAVGVGVIFHTFRWAIFEELLPALVPKKFRDKALMRRPTFEESRDPSIQAALIEYRDEHYRYYQCHGSLALAGPCLFLAWWLMRDDGTVPPTTRVWFFGAFTFVFSVVSAYAALNALYRHRSKRTALLTGARR